MANTCAICGTSIKRDKRANNLHQHHDCYCTACRPKARLMQQKIRRRLLTQLRLAVTRSKLRPVTQKNKMRLDKRRLARQAS